MHISSLETCTPYILYKIIYQYNGTPDYHKTAMQNDR